MFSHWMVTNLHRCILFHFLCLCDSQKCTKHLILLPVPSTGYLFLLFPLRNNPKSQQEKRKKSHKRKHNTLDYGDKWSIPICMSRKSSLLSELGFVEQTQMWMKNHSCLITFSVTHINCVYLFRVNNHMKYKPFV